MGLLLIGNLQYGLTRLQIEGAGLLEVSGLESLASLFLGSLCLLEKLLVALAESCGLGPLSDLEQLHHENKGGSWRDARAGALVSVSVLRFQHKFGLLTDSHARDAHIPALNDLPRADLEGKGRLGVQALIEHLIV